MWWLASLLLPWGGIPIWWLAFHEYMSIADDDAKLQKETEYKQQKMIIRKLIKKSKMQHYHEALNNARKNPNVEPTKATSTWTIEAKQMQFPEPHRKCQHLQQFFLQQLGRKRTTTRNRGIRPMDLVCRLSMKEHIHGS